MAEKKVIELEVKDNLGNLKQQLKQAQVEVQTLSEKFGATSAAAVEAAKKAAILKDKIGDAKALTDAFNPDAKFKALSGTLTGVAGGFSVVTGALGAFGTQSEDVEKALLKVQSAMALASGAQAIGESIDSFKQLGAVIKSTSIFQGIYNFVQTGSIKGTQEAIAAKIIDTEVTVAQGTATTGAAVATDGLGKSMKALPIIAIIAGIATIAYGIYEYVSASSKAETKEKARIKNLEELKVKQIEEQKARESAITSIVDETAELGNLLYAVRSSNAGSETRKNLINELNSTYGITLSNLKDEEQFQRQVNLAIADYISYQRLRILTDYNSGKMTKAVTDQQIAYDKVKKLGISDNLKEQFNLLSLGKLKASDIDYSNDMFFAAGKLTKEQKASVISFHQQVDAITRANVVLEEASTATLSLKKELDKNAISIGKQNKELTKSTHIKKEEITTTNDLKKSSEALTAFYDAIETERQAKITDAKEKELQELANKYEALYELADKAGKSTKDLQEQQGKDSQAITKKYNALEQVAKDEKTAKEKEKIAKEKAVLEELTLSESELKLAKLKTQYEADQLLYKDNKEILKALDIKYSKDKEVLESEELARQKTINEKKIQMAMNGLSIINDLFQMNAGKSEKDARKAFKAQKAFNLASALTNTYLAVTAALANKIELFPGQRFVEAGLAGAAGAVQVAKIAKTQFEGGGGGGGGGATAPTMSAPQFNVVGQSGVNQLASLNQQPIQAYVVSGQVTSQQALDRNRLANATLGG